MLSVFLLHLYLYRMEGNTWSGYSILDSPENPEVLRIVYCDMKQPYFESQLEREVGLISLRKPLRFAIEQTDPKLRDEYNPMLFSRVLKNDGWNSDILTGRFVVPKNGVYVLFLSGTTESYDATFSLNIESAGHVISTEDIFEIQNHHSARGFSRLIVKELKAGNEFYLSSNSYVLSGPTTPLRFVGLEIL
jgi:hypothetical protein